MKLSQFFLAGALFAAAAPAAAQDTIPMRRAHHALVYHHALQKVLLVGGSTPLDNGNRFEFFNDVWSYDGARWRKLFAGGARRSGERLAYDSRTRRIVSIGGFDGSQSVNDFRAFIGNEWKTIVPIADRPAAETGLVYDTKRSVFITFGGSAGRDRTHGDTWEFNGTRWSRVDVASSPEPRQAFAMVYDSKRARTIVFGGMGADPSQLLGNTWEYDGKNWMQVATSGPAARHSAGYTYDSKRGQLIIFGGYTKDGTRNDTWAWDGKTWKQLAADGPPARGMGQLAYDAKRDRVVLFGGRNGYPHGDRNDTWEFDGTRWIEPATTLAITNVNVVPMTRDTVIRNATVVIRSGRIGEISRSARTTGMRTVDAKGAYLIPGLMDMHTHLYSDGALHDSIAPYELGVMIANGVTAARMMAGTPEQRALRQQIRSGQVLGPQLWLASPYFSDKPGDNTRAITSPDDARAAVREMKAAGYDFIKNTFGIVGDAYDAMTDEARKIGIPVVGHVEPAVGVRRALAAGQQIEHLDAYFEAALADGAPMTASLTQFGVYRQQNWASIDHIDDRKLTEIAEATARAGVWSGPTLEIFNRAFGDPLTDAELMALPDWRFIPQSIKTPYMRSRTNYWAQPIPREKRKRYAEIRNTLVKRIHDAGGKIIAGSDSPDLLMVYGFAMHRELQALVKAGLTPYHALRAGTRNPAEFLNALNDFGTIEVGKRADLILVSGNPLTDISNTQKIVSVIVGGRLLERPQLDRMLEDAERVLR